eukprot:g10898.t1
MGSDRRLESEEWLGGMGRDRRLESDEWLVGMGSDRSYLDCEAECSYELHGSVSPCHTQPDLTDALAPASLSSNQLAEDMKAGKMKLEV